MASSNEALDNFSKYVLDSDPNLRFSLGVSSPSELSEKLALQVARRAIGIAGDAGLTQQADEVGRAISQGRLSEAIGLSERIHIQVRPENEGSLFGTVFQSITSGGHEEHHEL